MLLTFNFALWIIMLTNMLALLIALIFPYIISYKLINILTPGKEWVEISVIIVGLLTIYLINKASLNLSNKIKLVIEIFNEEIRKKDERIKALEKILHENKINLY